MDVLVIVVLLVGALVYWTVRRNRRPHRPRTFAHSARGNRSAIETGNHGGGIWFGGDGGCGGGDGGGGGGGCGG